MGPFPKETIEQKIDGRLSTIDKEIEKINTKIDTNDEVNKRMDRRLLVLEKEMFKSSQLSRRSEELRQKERELAGQPARRRQDKEPPKKTVNDKMARQTGEKELSAQKNKDFCPTDGNAQEKSNSQEEMDGRRLSTGSFRSNWVLEMERDLQQQAARLTLQLEGSREIGRQVGHNVLEDTTMNTKDILKYQTGGRKEMNTTDMTTGRSAIQPLGIVTNP